ncbi:hypothetical protein CSX04_08318 [Burkholderia cepacia]|nr:hypothetical protein CSX04_08318 [Burkholderia cepacia]
MIAAEEKMLIAPVRRPCEKNDPSFCCDLRSTGRRARKTAWQSEKSRTRDHRRLDQRPDRRRICGVYDQSRSQRCGHSPEYVTALFFESGSAAARNARGDRQTLFRTLSSFAENKRRSPQARLEAIIDDAFVEFAKPGLPASVLECWGLGLHEPFARDIAVDIQQQFTRLFAKLVEEINPALSAEECELRGALIMTSLEGLIVFLRWNEDDAAKRHRFHKATKVVWSGFGNVDE